MVPTLIPGFHTASLPEHDLATAGELLRRIGYDSIAVRLSLARLNPFAENSLRRMQINLLNQGIGGLSLVIDADSVHMIDPWEDESPGLVDGSESSDQRLGLLLAAVELASELSESGAQRRLITFSVGRKSTQIDSQESLDRLADVVSQIAGRAHELGVRLAVRPRTGHLVDSIGRFERLVEWVAGEGFLLLAADVGVMVAGGEMPVVDLLQRVGTRLGCVYLSELRTHGGSTEPLIGGGHVSAARVVDGLRGCGFNGPVVLEPVIEERGSPAEAKRLLESVFGARTC